MLVVALAFSIGGSAGFLLGCCWYALWNRRRVPESARSGAALQSTPSLYYRG